ncbi:TonB-dependent receptor [Aestuariibacter sp. AA17]|uniref:TonB-dependent receptor n=1 Tax=Fluctibacter corallii TaxID=2984329 RepID=A0ABT3ACS0_9ALTE|nr:TonB-dependent receptor [Aestuariibacter sp. AA17]MCV2886087.1 TonB-dependent receptor [Aestuariibacter sp. AA17]
MQRRVNRIALCVLSSFVCANMAHAQSAADTDQKSIKTSSIETITVTGAMLQTPLSKFASSVSVINDDAIAARQADHIEHILNRASNVNFSAGASRGRFFQIRGIGERSQFVDPINPSVGFIVDGINYSGMAAGASTFDIEQVEIYKGPNSARFGSDGLAGMINVVSKAPTADTHVNVEAGVANYNSWNAGVAAGTGITDDVLIGFSAHQVKSDGFIDNDALNRDDTNNHDEFTGRIKLQADITDTLRLSAVAHHIDVDNGYDAFSLDLNRTTLSDEPGFDKQESDAVALSALYDGLGGAKVKLTGTFLDADLAYGYDEDWSYVGIAPGWEYSSTDHYFRDRQDKTLELKVFNNNDTMNGWVLGAYYADEEEDLLRQFFDFDAWADASFQSQVEREDTALFGQYRFSVSDNAWVSVSGRFAEQSLDYIDTNGVVQQTDESDWGAELSYHVQVSDQTMAYVKGTRSYKMGGVNGEALGKLNDEGLVEFRDTLLANAAFDSESLLGTELGIKGGNPDGTFTMHFAAFYQWRDDVQYKSWIVRDQTFVGFYNNAGDGTNYGIELDLSYQLHNNVTLFAHLGWLDAELDGVTREDETTIYNGLEQAHAPSYTANVGLNITLMDGLKWVFEADAKDRFYYSYSHDQQSDNMVLVHSSVAYTYDNWEFSVYVRNLFDEDYATRGFYFGNDPRNEYQSKTYEQLGEPRRVGASVRYHF